MNWLIPAALATPLIGALLVSRAGRWPNLRESITAVASIVTLVFVALLVSPVMRGFQPEWEVFEFLPGVPLAFRVEPLGMLYALVAAGLWPATSSYAAGYLRGHHEKNQTRFFVCFALAIFAALGIAFAANLGTLFFFYEVLTLSTYPLVTHSQNAEAKKAGRVYLGILITTSVCFLLMAIVWTFHMTGTLDFRMATDGGAPPGILDGYVSDAALPILLGLYAYGAGKAALMPLHRWLPNAMVAPTPVSALLHAVAVVKAGVFTILKVIVYIFGIGLLQRTGASEWLMAVAAFTIIAASLIAFTQDNLKARLAYSTIAQLAYITLGAALATEDAVLGGAMHIATHAVGKITLFFCAGAIIVFAHETRVSRLDGLGKYMPWTMGAFLIAALSIIGLPPTGGSWSKWMIALGAADEHSFYIAVLMVSSLLNIGYLIPIPIRAFFFPAKPGVHAKEGPLSVTGPLVFTATLCVVLFFFGDVIITLLNPIVGR